MRELMSWEDGESMVVVGYESGHVDGAAGVYKTLNCALDYIADWLGDCDGHPPADEIRDFFKVTEIEGGWRVGIKIDGHTISYTIHQTKLRQ